MRTSVLDDVKRLLVEVMKETDDNPLVRDDDHITEDLGLDFLQMVAFLLNVEKKFGLFIDLEVFGLNNVGSVKHFAGVLESLMSGTQNAACA